MMRFAPRLRFVARPWRATLLALALVVSGIVAARAPVARVEFSADLLLSLLGSGTAIEVELPDDVRAVHVVATQGDAVVIDTDTTFVERTDGQRASAVVSVGAVGATLRCEVYVFIDVLLYLDGRVSRGSRVATCMEVEAPVSLRPAPVAPLGRFAGTSVDVHAWHVVDGFMPVMGPGGPRPTEDDWVVFHVYLGTDEAVPSLEELGITDR